MATNIEKAFNGRWRFKGCKDESIRELCRDFFEAGWLIGQGEEEAQVSDADFEKWWNMYQKKRGKEKCMKKWSKMSASEKRACIAATPAYVASTPNVAYRKDPYTYLNNKSWLDEIITGNTTLSSEQQRQQRLNEAARLIAGYAEEDQGTM